MKNILAEYLERIKKQRRIRHRIIALILVLSVVVSSVVTWGLHMDGVALAGDAYCGIEEHEHNENCYIEILTCTLAEEGHTHGEECYEEQPYVCEDEEHSHEDDPATVTVLVCEMDEVEAHEHSEDCYELTVSCGKEEHVHTLECYTDPSADVESTSDWEATLPENLQVTNAERLIQVAESQLGYQESENNYIVDDNGDKQGYTRYGAWYGNTYGEWSAMFVAFCLNYAGISQEDMPYNSGSQAWIVELSSMGLFADNGDHTPEAGDIIFFDTEGDGQADRAGIVTKVNGTAITVIEGDSDGSVQELSYSSDDTSIVGYGMLPEEESEEETAENTEETSDDTTETEENSENTEETETTVEGETTGSFSTFGISDLEGMITGLSEDDIAVQLNGVNANSETGGDGSSLEEAALLSISKIGESNPATLEVAGKNERYFKVTSEVAHEFTIKVEAQKSGASIVSRILDENGNYFSNIASSGRSVSKIISLEKDKTYYIEIKGYWNTTNTPVDVTITPTENHNYILQANGNYHCSSYCPDIVSEDGVLGKCGDNATWRIEDSVLYIEGTGDTYDFDSHDSPWYGMRSHFTEVVVSEGITGLGDNLFRDSTNILSVQLPDTVTTIGDNAFYNCDGITSMNLPAGLTEMGEGVFRNCDGLTSVVIQDGITSLPANTFNACKALTDVQLPDSITSIGTYAFSDCSSLVNITLPSDLTEMGSYAFYQCGSLESIVIPSGVTTISQYAFENCQKLKSVTLPDGLETIENNAFRVTSQLKEIVFPDSLTYIGNSAFSSTGLTEVTIPSGVTTINNSAFYNAQSLLKVTLPDGLKSLENSAFSNCKVLTEINLPEGLERIENSAFATTPRLKSIEIPTTVVRIISAFGTSNSETGKVTHEIYYNAANATTISDDSTSTYDVIIGKDVDVLPASFYNLIANSYATRSLVFEGENVINVTEGAFNSSKLPAALQGLSGDVFVDENGAIYRFDLESGTASLAYVPRDNNMTEYTVPATLNIPGSNGTPVVCTVTGVDDNALSGAGNLKTLSFEAAENITSVADTAFANCKTLVTLNGKNTVDSAKATFTNAGNVPNSAFYNTGLKNGSDADSFTKEDPTGKEVLQENIDDQGTLSVIVQMGESKTIEYVEGDNGSNYQLLTGDDIHFLISADTRGATDFTERRIYVEMTQDDIILPFGPGESRTYKSSAADDSEGKGVVVTCHETEVPGVYYYSFVPNQGETVSFPLVLVYPSPSTDGGGVRVWTEVMDDDNTATDNYIAPDGEQIEAWWSTGNDIFEVTKTISNIFVLRGDGQGNVSLRASSGTNPLRYYIETNRSAVANESYGRDLVKKLRYTDRFSLPAGMSWNEKIRTAMAEGNWTYALTSSSLTFYVGGVQVATVSGFARVPSEVTLEMTDDGDMVYGFSIVNNSSTTQMNQGTLTFDIYTTNIDVDLEVYSEEENSEETVYNGVDLDVELSYSDPQHDEDSTEYRPTYDSAKLEFLKDRYAQDTNMGGNAYWYLKVNNTGATNYDLRDDNGKVILTDTLPQYQYITEDKMEEMLRNQWGKYLTITIQGATLAAVGGDGYYSAWATDGTKTATITPWNTDMEMITRDLVITWDNDQITVNGTPINGTLKEYLRSIGYAVTDINTIFTVTWDISEYHDGLLYGGENRTFTVLSTNKDTFQYGAEDWLHQHPVNKRTINNSAYLNNLSKGNYTYAARESYVTKSVSSNGRTLSQQNMNVVPGDVLEYSLFYSKNSSSGELETLPMMDIMAPGNVLLVPKALNPTLATLGLEELEDGGIVYYKLSEPGTYSKVWVGIRNDQDIMADNVIVHEDGAIEIRWYFKNVGTDYSSSRISVTYKTVVEPSDVDDNEDGLFDIDNWVYMNDKVDNRIYAPFGVQGSIIGADKKILQEDGSLVGYSTLSEGETITYQLKIENLKNGPYTLSGGAAPGADLYDVLPDTTGTGDSPFFEWVKGENVRLSYETVEGTNEINGLDDWSIESYTYEDSATGTEKTGYRIVWPSSTYIKFNDIGEFHIYVELDYPEGDTWFDYATAANGRQLENVFYCSRFPHTVYHDMTLPAVADLQKGVAAVGRRKGGLSYDNYTSPGGNRMNYSNDDVSIHYVQYYVSLYNDGVTRLYLNELVDTLPRGFTIKDMQQTTAGNQQRMSTGSMNTSNINNLGNTTLNRIVEIGDEQVTYPKATIYLDSYNMVDGVQTLRFSIRSSRGEGDLQYDEMRGQYYLNPNEAIAFKYIVRTNKIEDTEEIATNTIKMLYTDYLGAGVTTSDVEIAAVEDPKCEGQNDGDRRVERDAESGESYLTSRVTVRRGEIVPGISKRTKSTTVVQGDQSVTEDYEGSARDDAIVNWEATVVNDGTRNIEHFIFTDEMEQPYTFTGNIELSYYSNTTGLLFNKTITPDERARTESGQEFTIQATVEGYTSNIGKLRVRIYTDEDSGNEIFTMENLSYGDYGYGGLSIPAGGYATIGLSTVNNTDVRANKVYTNRVNLTPLDTTFNETSDGRVIADEDGNYVSVEATAPVNVVFGYATTSLKKIYELDEPDNATDSNQTTRYILLDEKEDLFRYTLEVNTPKDERMSTLIMIDSLPEVGDHSPFDESVYRNSEFEVSLADDPDFVVTVKERGQEAVTLDPSQYTIEYSDATSFTDGDWNGVATGKWSSTKSGTTRSFRIQLHQGEDYAAAKDATVNVMFTAKITGDAQPGQIAWNSFGYHYGVKPYGQEITLEAMPLEVGVKIPAIPSLQKKLVYLDGSSHIAEKEESFVFLIHTGERLSSYEELTEEILNGRDYTIVVMTVPEGSSTSEKLKLNQQKKYTLSESGQWQESEELFEWINDTKYTVVEIEMAENYELYTMARQTRNSYTFTYLDTQERTIVCENETLEWDLKLTKTSASDGHGIKGGLFGIYSKDEAEGLSEEAYEKLSDAPERVIDIGGESWYLMNVKGAGEEGLLEWKDLTGEEYYVYEHKAPEGYVKSETGWNFYRTDSTAGVLEDSITNSAGAVLPRTGGSGRLPWTVAGIVLMSLSVISAYGMRNRRKRRGE